MAIEPSRRDLDDPLTHERVIAPRRGVGIDPRHGAEFVGRYTAGSDKFLAAVNWRSGYNDFLTRTDLGRYDRTKGAYPSDPYRLFGNNSQNFAARMRRNLGFP